MAITAALAYDKQLTLLDEALSNLDWVSRQRILQCPSFHGRTIIYASHEEVLMGRETGTMREDDLREMEAIAGAMR